MPFIIPANTLASGGFDVANSLRFNDGSSDFLNRTTGTPTLATKCTFSLWVKRSALGSTKALMGFHSSDSNRGNFVFEVDKLELRMFDTSMQLTTNRLFRDVSAWYHIVLAIDTTQGTASNRVKLYINGVQETSFATSSYPSQDSDFGFNKSGIVFKTTQKGEQNDFFDGYISEFVMVDGLALAPTDFGEFDEDSGIWKPIKVSGLTFGDNGFYLEIKGAGTSANSSGLGADTSGNTNHFAVNNLTAVDQSTDTCTNNFATLNSLDNYYAATTFSEGNLKAVTNSGNETYNIATIGVASGKWYWEVKIVNSSTNGTYGITDSVSRGTSNFLGDDAYDTAYLKDGKVYRDSGYVSGFSNANTLTAYDTGAILMFALDLTNNALYAGHNGTWGNSSDPTSGASKTGAIPIDAITSTGTGFYFPAFGEWTGGASATYSVNFGSPEFAISSGNTDGNGYGNFEYAVPSSYYSLNTKNLAEYG